MFVVVSVHTNRSNVAFNVVIWLSFLSINVLRSTFDGYFLNDKYVRRVKKGFLDTAVDR